MNADPGRLHHVELWVPDLSGAIAEWGWLLTAAAVAAEIRQRSY